MSPFLKPFLDALLLVLDLIGWLVLVWVILSWIMFFVRQTSFRWRHRQMYAILEQLDEIFTRMTHPLLRPFRRLLPPHRTAGIDWSPMLLFLAIFILRGLMEALKGLILVPSGPG